MPDLAISRRPLSVAIACFAPLSPTETVVCPLFSLFSLLGNNVWICQATAGRSETGRIVIGHEAVTSVARHDTKRHFRVRVALFLEIIPVAVAIPFSYRSEERRVRKERK